MLHQRHARGKKVADKKGKQAKAIWSVVKKGQTVLLTFETNIFPPSSLEEMVVKSAHQARKFCRKFVARERERDRRERERKGTNQKPRHSKRMAH